MNWYTPGLSGIRERIDLNFASADIMRFQKIIAKITNECFAYKA
jgi:hypothetical protein